MNTMNHSLRAIHSTHLCFLTWSGLLIGFPFACAPCTKFFLSYVLVVCWFVSLRASSRFLALWLVFSSFFCLMFLLMVYIFFYFYFYFSIVSFSVYFRLFYSFVKRDANIFLISIFIISYGWTFRPINVNHFSNSCWTFYKQTLNIFKHTCTSIK